jgi:dihydrofolate synthase/folylpolyglutamate synthase
MNLVTFEDSLAYLESFRSPVALPGLGRMQRLLLALGSPEGALDVVHVTGTNGKGSVSRLVEAAFRSMGLRAGMYTSPHLEHVRERITVAGEPIDATTFARFVTRIGRVFEEFGTSDRPTHFEVLTAVGFLAFAEANLDVLVLEAGIGGRVDATNVAAGRVAVLTNVELDHTDVLGSTREEIASEKAGIIKPGAIVVVGETDRRSHEVIDARCTAVGATPWRFGTEVQLCSSVATADGRAIDLVTPFGEIDGLVVGLHGRHQATNAALAVAAIEAFTGEPVVGATLTEAWRHVANPGRFEIIEGDRTVVIDVAHNPHGVSALTETLDERFPRRPRIVVVGINPHKDVEAMLHRLQPHTRVVITTEVANAPAVPATILGKLAAELGYPEVHIEPRAEGAIAAAMAIANEDDVVVLTGSHYWIGEIRRIVTSAQGPR